MDKLSPEGPCPPAEFLCVSWMLEKGDQSDGVSADTGEEFSQSHRLRTTKSPHLTDEETEAPKEATPSVVSQPVRVEPGPEPRSLDLQPPFCSCSALDPQLPPQEA